MIMNKSFRMVVLVVVALLFTAFVAEAQTRIATVDLTQVFEKYWKTKRARLALADRKADLKKDLDGLQETHKKLVQEYQKLLAEANDQAVSAEERDRRQKAVEAKVRVLKDSEETLKQFVSRGDAELDQQMRRMMDDVLKDIREAVAAKGKAGGFNFVVDSKAESLSKAPVFLYSSEENDLSAAVLEQLNAAAPPEPAGANDKTGDKK
jgi:Skp family chaperone for outer membrane proteins